MGNMCNKQPSKGGVNKAQQNRDSQKEQETEQNMDFPKYYQKIRDALKQQKFIFGDPADSATFQQRIELLNGITSQEAQEWLDGYIDYMILRGYVKKYHADKDTETYPPYSIQQVQRLHILYHTNYVEFCGFSGFKVIHFNPFKVISSSSVKLREKQKEAYEYTRELLIKYKGVGIKESTINLFEDFDLTFIKYEFSFYFLQYSDRQQFEKNLASSWELFKKMSYSNDSVKECYKNLRKVQEIDFFRAKYQVPKIQDALTDQASASEDLKQIAQQIDSIQFPDSFIRLLSWEYVLDTNLVIQMITEYKKFLLIAATTKGFTPQPSEKINIVWQLHRQYTKQYADQVAIMEQIKPQTSFNLDNKFEQTYLPNFDKTKQAYTEIFGAQAPSEIWQNQNPNRFIEFPHAASISLFILRPLLSKRQVITAIKKYQEYQSKLGKRTEADFQNPQVVSKILMQDPKNFSIKIDDPKFFIQGKGREVSLWDFRDREQEDSNDLSFSLVRKENLQSQSEVRTESRLQEPQQQYKEEKKESIQLSDVVVEPKNLDDDKVEQKVGEEDDQVSIEDENSNPPNKISENSEDEGGDGGQGPLELEFSPNKNDSHHSSLQNSEEEVQQNGGDNHVQNDIQGENNLNLNQIDNKDEDDEDEESEIKMDFMGKDNLSLDDEEEEEEEAADGQKAMVQNN